MSVEQITVAPQTFRLVVQPTSSGAEVTSVTVQPEQFRLVVQPEGLQILSVATQGPPGTVGPPGPQGEPGRSATFFEYKFDASTDDTPPVGEVQVNHSDQTLATAVYLNILTANDADVHRVLGRATVGQVIDIQDRDDSTKYQSYRITGAPLTVGDHVTIPVAWEEGGLALTAQPVWVAFLVPATMSIPPGGTTGQVLMKVSNADYDVYWATVAVIPPGEGEDSLDFAEATNSMYVPVLF